MKLNSSSPSKSRVIQVCLFLVRLFLLGIVTLVLLIGIAWALGALWFDFPFSGLRRPLAAVFGLSPFPRLRQSANELHDRPQWYNELFSNCTSNVRLHIKHIGSAHPWDWQLLLNGFIAEHAYELGALDASLPFAELRRLSYIDYRARDADDDPTFSSLIRKGLPGMP